MKKLLVSAILFLSVTAFGTIDSLAQLKTDTFQAQSIVLNNEDKPARTRAVGDTLNASTFDFEKKILELLNHKRAENGLPPLRWSDDVAGIARTHSENMAKFKFFSHIGQDGKAVDDRADSIGLNKWKAIGENIAYNRGFENPAESVCESWMKSVSHRGNLLNNRWKETGIGVAVAPDGTYFYTQVFLAR